MTLTASRLSQNLYAILDQVLATGEPVEIERNGRRLLIQAEHQGSIWDRLEVRECSVGDREELVHMDWSEEWRGQDLP